MIATLIIALFLNFGTCTESYQPPADKIVDEEDIDLLARVAMSEASTLNFDAKVAVVQTVLNRLYDTKGEFKKQTTLQKVVKGKAFSTQDNGDPDEECYDAVFWAIEYMPYPTDMYWFCKAPDWYGYQYCSYGSGKRKTYFFTKENYND